MTKVPDPADLLANAPSDPLTAVAWLSQMRAAVDRALDEAMATAAMEGASSRAVADAAGVAPNTVPARLGRTPALSPYADEAGRVGSEGVARARYDREQGRVPAAPAPPAPAMRFQRRTPTGGIS